MKKIYISGKITGLSIEEAKQRFNKAAFELTAKYGCEVINPIRLFPEGADLTWEEYLEVCLIALKDCDAIYYLNNYKDSRGAMRERKQAQEDKLTELYEPPKKLIIAGGRDFGGVQSYRLLIEEADRMMPDEIISGCAKGADALGMAYAGLRGLKLHKRPADWAKHGKAAGPIRNAEMAEAGDALLAFWDGESKGTKNMIEVARRKGLEVKVIPYG